MKRKMRAPKGRNEPENRETMGSETVVWRQNAAPVGGPPHAETDRRFIRRALLWSFAAAAVLVLFCYVVFLNLPELKEVYVKHLIERGSYQSAQRVIQSLEPGEETDELQNACYFACAGAYQREGGYDEAIALYEAAGDYPGAADALDECIYDQARIFESDGDYPEASEKYAQIAGVLDADERREACRYAYALELYDNGSYDEAMREFYALGDYLDAETYARESAVALSGNVGAGDLVALLAGLTEEQLAAREALQAAREALPVGVVATGYQHTVARKRDGTVLATGSNRYGQCNVSDWTNVSAVAAGAYHTVALLSDGTVVACGQNEYGQCDVSGWTNVIRLYAGAYNTVALTSGGEILSAGYVSYETQSWHDIADLDVGAFALFGVMENGRPLSTNQELITDDFNDLVAISATAACSAGLKAGGTVVTNGLDADGLTDIVAICCTENGLFALDAEGSVHTRFYRSEDEIDVSGWDDIVAVSAGATHAAAVTGDGRVLAAGDNAKGQCDTSEWRLFEP